MSGPNNSPSIPNTKLDIQPSYESNEQDGPLPDGLYVLTNNKSRTVLDLSVGTLTSKVLVGCTGFSQLSFITPGTVGWAITTMGPRGFERKTDYSIADQLWIVKHETLNDTYTLRNYGLGTYLDLSAGPKNGSLVTANNRSLADESRRNQEWRIIEEEIDQYKNPANGTSATCSALVDSGDHQLWTLERVSRKTREIKTVLESWKPGIRLFQPYGDDAEYLSPLLPATLAIDPLEPH
ncbi:hypothetical protein FRC00_010194 [Tulasnella sp. 408]|nr:hypothetical protein FRC00_010194 [Tulasnella sp. 408]